MKIIREKVLIPKNQSFRLFKPSLRNRFYWHYHPEVELVYVEATTGIRHVGQHISSYIESDLIMIGSNIPHLNFDYGLKTEYNQIVVQLDENFLGTAPDCTPEFEFISNLFQRSSMGLSFHGKTKKIAGERLRNMQHMNTFAQLVELIDILHYLSKSKEVVVLNDRDTSVKTFLKDKIRMGAVYQYIDQHFDKDPDVNAVAESVHLTTAAFCRYFKRQTLMTFTDFVNQYRINHAKNLLLQDKTVTEACYAVGIESLSYFNKLFNKVAGENPMKFKKRYVKN